MRIKLIKEGGGGEEWAWAVAARYMSESSTNLALRNQHNTVNIAFFHLFRFTNIATTVTSMGNKDLDKKWLMISSSSPDTNSIEAAQDGNYIKMTLTEYLILRLTAIKDSTKIWEKQIFSWVNFKWKYKP